jgi:hypothetical protein
LFLFLSLAFVALSASWVDLAMVKPSYEHRHVVYLLRLLAFAAIMIASPRPPSPRCGA